MAGRLLMQNRERWARCVVVSYAAEWEGQFYREKKVMVYYKEIGGAVVLLTVKARYGPSFQKG